ncbi:Hypothetical predicted protein [Mytilus galloprovincialis]|uniref:C3H1-type domain-containing protein n=1 Tax=Mytilus galloprovincialis TaxID=29158 RepID=A0A8B6F3A5_MYTGA|nr:Hypothetical predicted protein [Mytilus galloprovincialis]
MSDSYVDFVTLSPNFNEDEDDDVLFKSKAVKISTYAKPKQLFSIHQWTEAFDIYMSIYYVNHPEHILSLIKYAYNVRAMSKQFGFNMAKSYDETFRKVRRVMKFDWAVVNDDLWRTAFYDHFNRSNTNTGNNASNNKHVKQSGGPPFQRRVQQQSSQFPPGYCWTYCRTGGCSSDNCKHKHQCVCNVIKNMPQSHVKSGLQPTSLPTPIKVNKLNIFLKGYDKAMKLNLIQGFTFGFKINSLLDKKVDKFPSNHKSARENPDAVNLKLNKEIMKGRIKGPFDEPPFDKFYLFSLWV